MAENKFIKHLKGAETAGSVLEIKNQGTPATFGNMPAGTSNPNTAYADARGDATGVLKGTDNWKLDGSTLTLATQVYGDGRDLTGTYTASGNTLWVNGVYTFGSAKIFSPNTKWVLKLCGANLLSAVADTINFSLIIKFGSTPLVTKTFTVAEQANNFCQQFVIDFNEWTQNVLKATSGDTLTIQLLCGDSTASATIYNGMTTLTALQRRVDGDVVASDTSTFDDLEQDVKDLNDEVEQIQEDLGDLEEYVDDTFVRLDGNSTMTGPLKMRATSSFQCAIAPFWDGVGFYKLNSDDSVTLIASIETPDGFLPWTTNTYNIGSSLKKWKNLYLAGKAYVPVINNGYDIAVPVTNSADTLALKSEVDLAANSGRMITDQGLWYAKMYSATVAPSAEDGTNYADFSQTDGQGNPIIVTYNRVNGAWVQDQTITPPAEYDGYVPITSKIWDIAEQAGQQGGRILWNHQSKEFTPYPQIISFEDIEVTGTSTVIMPQNPSTNQIVNKDYVDNAIGNGTITITQGGVTKGSFTLNQATSDTIELSQGVDNSIDAVLSGNLNISSNGDITGFLTWPDKVTLPNRTIDYDQNLEIVAVITTPSGPFVFNTGIIVGRNEYASSAMFGVTATTSGVLQCHINGATYNGSTILAQATKYYIKLVINQTTNVCSVSLSTDGIAYATEITGSFTSPLGNGQIIFQPHISDTYVTTLHLAECYVIQGNIIIWQGLGPAGLQQRVAKGHEVIEFQAPTAQNNYTWYRKYADGWVEQGGRVKLNGTISATNKRVTFPVEMATSKYIARVDNNANVGAVAYVGWESTTGMSVGLASGSSTNETTWEVKGMAAQ